MILSVVGVISETFAVVKKRFPGLLGLWVTYFAITIGVMIIMLMLVGGSFAGMVASLDSGGPLGAGLGAGLGVGMIWMMVLFYLFYLLVLFAQYGSLCIMASPLRNGDFGDALDTGFRSAPVLLVTTIILIVAYFILSLILGIVSATLAKMGTVAVAAGGLLVLGGFLYLGCRLSPMIAIASVDGVRNPIAVISRSWALTRGNVLQILGAIVVFLIGSLIVLGIAILPLVGSTAVIASGDLGAAGGVALLSVLLLFVAGIVVALSYSALISVIHAQLVRGIGGELEDTFS